MDCQQGLQLKDALQIRPMPVYPSDRQAGSVFEVDSHIATDVLWTVNMGRRTSDA